MTKRNKDEAVTVESNPVEPIEVLEAQPEIPPPPPVPVIDTPPAADANAKQTIEHWKIVAKTPDWLWAGMKLGKGWPIGKEVTRAEYDEAVDWAANVECR